MKAKSQIKEENKNTKIIKLQNKIKIIFTKLTKIMSLEEDRRRRKEGEIRNVKRKRDLTQNK